MMGIVKKLFNKKEKDELEITNYTNRTIFNMVFDEWIEKRKPRHKTHDITVSLDELSDVYSTISTVSRITKSLKERGKVDVSQLEEGCNKLIVKETDQIIVIKKDLFRFEFMSRTNKRAWYRLYLEHEGRELKIAEGELSYREEEMVEMAYGRCLFDLKNRGSFYYKKEIKEIKKVIESIIKARTSLQEERNCIFVNEVAWESVDEEPWMETFQHTLTKVNTEVHSLSRIISEKQKEELEINSIEKKNREKVCEDNKEYFRTLTRQ